MTENIYEVIRVPGHGINWKQGLKELIVQLYQDGMSISEIGKRFGNLHYETIKKILLNFNIALRTRSLSKMKYTKNSQIFKNIDTPEKAYWLGVLASDGYVGRNQDNTSGNNVIKLTLKDKDVVEKFKKFLSTTQEIRYDESKDVYILSFQDKEMAMDLVNKGIFNHKSLILQPPNLDNIELEYHFIRGYFDGDGGVNVYTNNNSKKIQMYFTGTYDVIDWIKSHFNTTSKIFQEHRCLNNTYRLQICGTNLCYDCFQKMYTNSSENTRMNRKYNVFINYYNERFNK